MQQIGSATPIIKKLIITCEQNVNQVGCENTIHKS